MIKTLLLVRHAQSINTVPGLKDIDRNLTEKGIQEAYKTGKYLNHMNQIPELIYTSHALRAINTAQMIAEQTGIDNRHIIVKEDLYEASMRILLKIINELNDLNNRVLMIGHNPAISYLCEFLSGDPLEEMPPTGLCILNFNVMEWKLVNKSTGRLVEYKTPSEMNF